MSRNNVMRSILSAVLFLIIAVPMASAGSLGVKVGLTPEETLPGVPVTVDLRISNLTARDIAISSRVVFTVTTASGDSSRLSVVLPKQYWNGEAEASSKYMVPAGGEIRLFMPVTEWFNDSPLFDEERLNRPGDYDLVATVKGTSGSGGDSNRVHLRVTTPTGVDETVWKSLLVDGQPFTAADVRANCTTIRAYPLSRYYQLVSSFCVSFSTLNQYAHDVLQGLPSLPAAFRDAARLAVAEQYLQEARAAYGQNKLALAGSISDAGRPIAQDLIDQPGSDFGPVAGAWLKTELASEAGWRSRYQRVFGPRPTAAVSPLVTCISDNGDGTFSAEFGYDNPNNGFTKVAIGGDNHLAPGPDYQGQPTNFDPGKKESAFTVKGLTGVAKWTLQGKTVKASIAQSPKCSDVNPSEPQP